MHLIFTIFFVVTLLFLIFSIAGTIIKGYSSQTWLKFHGLVISRKVYREHQDDSQYVYRLLLNVEYFFRGNRYICSDIFCDENKEFVSEEDADSFIKEAQVGDHIVIYINPRKPKQSAIFKSENPDKNLVGIIYIFIWFTFCYFIGKNLS